MNFTEYSHHALEKFLSDSLILSAKDDAAMPTEAFVPLDCFIAADFFFFPGVTAVWRTYH